LRRNARRYPQKIGVIEKDKRLTFADLNKRVNRIANALRKEGFGKGDKIAVLAENCLELFEMYFVAAVTGMVLVPLNYRLNKNELLYMINHSEAKAFLFQDTYAAMALEMKPDLKQVKKFTVIPKKGGEAGSFSTYDELLAETDERDLFADIQENDLFCIIYTGGTTGLPKGVMLSHKNILASAVDCVLAMNVKFDDISVYVLPLFHVSNWTAFGHFFMGATNIIVDKWNPEHVLKIIAEEKATHINMVPTMVIQLIQEYEKRKDEFRLESLQTIGYAGAPMPVEVLKKGLALFGNKFFQVYGLTEASPLVTFLSKEDHVKALENPAWSNRLNSVGKEVHNVHVRVVNENGEHVKPNEVGEITVYGDNVMQGYWKDPEQTAQALRNGWLHTGDLGTVDGDGYIYIVDRKKDMIISGGENIYPKEVENVLYSHEAVLEAAVIGVPDELWGENVCAYIVLKEGYQVTEEEIIRHCTQHLASYKKPKVVRFVKELPKTAVGKLDKKVLREQAKMIQNQN